MGRRRKKVEVVISIYDRKLHSKKKAYIIQTVVSFIERCTASGICCVISGLHFDQLLSIGQ